MRHLDLFSGIGGFALAASWVWPDHEVVAFCDCEPFAGKVLNKHWPDVPVITDIRKIRQQKPLKKHVGYDYGAIDIITGGFPCQPFSCAGKRGGENDDRFLWPEMLRVIREVRPKWVLGENVAGIINMALDQVCADLEDAGYTVQAFVIPACAVDAEHIRERLWIVAHASGKSESQRLFNRNCEDIEKWRQRKKIGSKNWFKHQVGPKADLLCGNWFELSEPKMVRITNGLSSELDRLKGLGNAIVPQVAAVIMEAIKEAK